MDGPYLIYLRLIEGYMKISTLFLAIILVVSCKNHGRIDGKHESNNASSIQKPPVISVEEIKTKMEFFTSDKLMGRKSGSPGQVKAGEYIEDFFTSNNIVPYFQTYRDSFPLKEGVGFNVVGYLEGKDVVLKNDIVILGAHYDHIGISKNIVDGDSIANGANDDASGTVAILELAKHFKALNNNKRSVVFALFDAEEMGLIGSKHMAERIKSDGSVPYAMINFELVGVPGAPGSDLSFITGYDVSTLPQVLNNAAKDTVVGFSELAKKYQLFKSSDNYGFYEAFNMPAHAISTTDLALFPYYHTVDDEYDKMDFDHMKNFIEKMIPALDGLINGPRGELKMNE